jgi:hypothetical protein
MHKLMLGGAAIGLIAGVAVIGGETLWKASAEAARTPSMSTGISASQQTELVAAAADAFLATLTPKQQRAIQFAFVPQKVATVAHFQRAAGAPRPSDHGPSPTPPPVETGQGDRPSGAPGHNGPPGGVGMGPPGGFVGEQYGPAVWSNYPVSDVPRPGLKLGSLTPTQRNAALHLLESVLSPSGYRKAQAIMGSDQALHDAGQPFDSGCDAYTLAVFGRPSATSPWMIQFGGHHLALNLVMKGAHGSVTPTLTGAQPAVYTEHGKTVRVLAGENDKAFELLGALDPAQRKQAILSYKIDDLVLGPGHDGETIVPEGLRGSALSSWQKALLLDLIAQWAGIISEPYSGQRMAEIKAGLDDTWFAWSGPTTHAEGRNGSAYYRIQGPKLFIEFSPQGVGGDPTMHVHTIYRDATNEYGRAFIGNGI